MKLILTTLILVAIAGTVSAKESKSKENNKNAKCHVDANNNGICDKKEDKTCNIGKGEGKKDGTSRKKGTGQHLKKGKKDGSNNGCCNHGAKHSDCKHK